MKNDPHFHFVHLMKGRFFLKNDLVLYLMYIIQLERHTYIGPYFTYICMYTIHPSIMLLASSGVVLLSYKGSYVYVCIYNIPSTYYNIHSVVQYDDVIVNLEHCQILFCQ